VTWTMIEPFAGTAALSMHLLGAKKQVVPYQGSKWKYRHTLKDLVRNYYRYRPQRVVLADTGPWLDVHQSFRDGQLPEVISILHRLAQGDPRDWFEVLNKGEVRGLPPVRAAEFLFLQRLAFRGKAVGIVNGEWRSPGFNTDSAYGKAASDSFGKINPMVPRLVELLRNYRASPPPDTLLFAEAQSVLEWVLQSSLKHRACVYMDPPYAGTTGYPTGGVTMSEVVEMALEFKDSGAMVMVSHNEPIEALISDGWYSLDLRAKTTHKKPFQSKKREFVTWLPARTTHLSNLRHTGDTNEL